MKKKWFITQVTLLLDWEGSVRNYPSLSRELDQFTSELPSYGNAECDKLLDTFKQQKQEAGKVTNCIYNHT